MSTPQDKLRCQSCGMPLSQSFNNIATQSDGETLSDYCTICYCRGEFVQPEQTLQQMLASSIDNMTQELGMPMAQATQLAQDIIPQLSRWKR